MRVLQLVTVTCTLFILPTNGQLFDMYYDMYYDNSSEEIYGDIPIKLMSRSKPLYEVFPGYIVPGYIKTAFYGEYLDAKISWMYPTYKSAEFTSTYQSRPMNVWAAILGYRSVTDGFVYEAALFIPIRYGGYTQKCFLKVSTYGQLVFNYNYNEDTFKGCMELSRDIDGNKEYDDDPTVFIKEYIEFSQVIEHTFSLEDEDFDIPKVISDSVSKKWQICTDRSCSSFVKSAKSPSYSFPNTWYFGEVWFDRYVYYTSVIYDEDRGEFTGAKYGVLRNQQF